MQEGALSEGLAGRIREMNFLYDRLNEERGNHNPPVEF